MIYKSDLEILIDEEGNIKFHVKGVKGKKCVDIAKSLAKEIGELKDLSFTSEYYQKETTTGKNIINETKRGG